MEFLGTVIVGTILSAPVVGPTGVEFERLVDETDHFPGNGSPVFFDGPPPVPCGEGVALRALADAPQSWIYYATPDGVQVVADEDSVIPGAGAPFEEVGDFSCLGGNRLVFLGGRSSPPEVRFSAFQWTPESGVELIQNGGVSIDGAAFFDFVEVGGKLSGIGLKGRLDPFSLGRALAVKPFGMEPVFVADETVILPGRTDPVSVFTSPQMLGEDLLFGALIVDLSRGLYRWSQTSGFSVVVDNTTPVPGTAETFLSINNYTVLSTGIAFTGLFSGGAGIFHFDEAGAVEPLVLPGDQTVGGESIVTAFTPRGKETLFSFRGTTVETAPFESVFARTGDGSIYRLLGVQDLIEGKKVLLVDGEADKDTVAVRVTVDDLEEIIYTADFGETLPIPVLSRSTLATLTILLLGTGLWLLARSR